MCGRDSGHYTWAEVHAFSIPLTVIHPKADPAPNYNRAPGTEIWTLFGSDSEQLLARELRWGLVPPWSMDKSRYSINARVETVAEKPSFRAALRNGQRCVIPASGYYEWGLGVGGATPYYIQALDEPILMFAGLWEHNAALNLDSYCILTQPALPEVERVHDRSPLLLGKASMSDWIFGNNARALERAVASKPPRLRFHKVGPEVGNVRNKGPSLIAPVEKQADLFSS